MILTTSEYVHGHDISDTLGLVRGSSIRTRHLGADITEWLRNLGGAELSHYTKMMAEAREEALGRMQDEELEDDLPRATTREVPIRFWPSR